MTSITDPLLNANEVAAALGLKVGTVRRYRTGGRDFFHSKAIKLNSAVRWRKSDLEEYINSLPSAS